MAVDACTMHGLWPVMARGFPDWCLAADVLMIGINTIPLLPSVPAEAMRSTTVSLDCEAMRSTTVSITRNDEFAPAEKLQLSACIHMLPMSAP